MQVPKRRLRKKQKKADILAVLNRKELVSRRPTERLAEGKGELLKPLSIAAGLEPYTETLDRRRAAHLLRRTSFGAHPTRLNAMVGQQADVVVDQLVDEAFARALPVPPSWANTRPPSENASEEVFEAFFEQNNEWLFSFIASSFKQMYQDGLREKMMLFWHNHFVTGMESYGLASFAYRYVTLLRTHALGNFKTFVHAIGIDPAMLYYLDGFLNQVGAPNENYARELLELFTAGIVDDQGNPNYTEGDIEQIARALTGWFVDWHRLEVSFDTYLFDEGEKTFFGRTGSFGYDDVIDILFEERAPAIARFICRKLYREFVYAAPDETIVAELATLFQANNFEIAPVVRALLKSAHFFDAQTVGAHIKSPVEELLGITLELQRAPADPLFEVLFWLSGELGQWVLEPPNVAGWPGHRSWLNTSTLINRWDFAGYMLYDGEEEGLPPHDLKGLAETLHDANDALAIFRLPVALVEHLISIPVEELDIEPLADGFGGDLVSFPIPSEIADGPAYVRELAKRFLQGVPWYEWDLNLPEAPELIRYFLHYIVELPEFQLA